MEQFRSTLCLQAENTVIQNEIQCFQCFKELLRHTNLVELFETHNSVTIVQILIFNFSYQNPKITTINDGDLSYYIIDYMAS